MDLLHLISFLTKNDGQGAFLKLMEFHCPLRRELEEQITRTYVASLFFVEHF